MFSKFYGGITVNDTERYNSKRYNSQGVIIMKNRKYQLAVLSVFAILLQSCLMTIVHPVRRINSSTFIDDKRFEVATVGEITHAFEIDEEGGRISTMSSLADFELGYKLNKSFKIMADYSLNGGHSGNYSGYLFMSGFEKTFELKNDIYYAVTSQAQYSSVKDSDEFENGTHRVTIDNKIKAVNLINEIVYQPDLRFVVRTGIYYDHIWSETKISGVSSKQIKYEDDVIGIPFKASARFRNFELFGGFMHFESLNTGKNDPDTNSYFLGLKYSFGEL